MTRRKIPAPPPERDPSRVIERPDGFYWQSLEDDREFGPFRTSREAQQHMQLQSEAELEPGESLEEAEDEVGISGWVDPDTGELAEEGVPRLEDH
ncbi:MAG: hypothetical protein JSS40_06505 [Proteobacteria bacterium]|nr:hypothetical protein [Pseudomonadota bacterium]